MCALFPPPLWSCFGWPQEDPMSHHHQQSYYDTNNYNIPPGDDHIESGSSGYPFLDFPPPPPISEIQQLIQYDDHHHSSQSPPSLTTPQSNNSEQLQVVEKKLSHNASERDRRKKINYLYSSLRSLLPPSDQTKKSSIPATVSRVLKYIPELQQQVERLVRRKEELLSKISKRDERILHENQRIRAPTKSSSLTAVSTSCLSNKELVVQISTHKVHKVPLSQIFLNLEKDGLAPLNCTSFESFGNMLFCSLHLQMNGTCSLECDALSQKLMSLHDNKSFP
ncbi:hypothetical protein Tsubulata_003552 [Turnera subulata]|uniref:BHLH domain-containing protein n=1 Tax=Turnera subulata TaxID=218843 RepID=A0A9Q0G910_9ROSI|nr:hypothetical protein Tsubulata_003552 [Turnera subulata]